MLGYQFTSAVVGGHMYSLTIMFTYGVSKGFTGCLGNLASLQPLNLKVLEEILSQLFVFPFRVSLVGYPVVNMTGKAVG
jgi:hypothetical protein